MIAVSSDTRGLLKKMLIMLLWLKCGQFLNGEVFSSFQKNLLWMALPLSPQGMIEVRLEELYARLITGLRPSSQHSSLCGEGWTQHYGVSSTTASRAEVANADEREFGTIIVNMLVAN